MALVRPVAAQSENARGTALAGTIKDIRAWLVSEQIEPVEFKAAVGRAGLGFEISFREKSEAERFQQQFASLLV
jgi:hypothetical protein